MKPLNFLNYQPINHEAEFTEGDSEKIFKKKLKTKPADWTYRTKKITYRNNEYGFRTKSFDKIDWKDSIVIFGCSNVYGIGLADEDTIPCKLEKLLDIPVINLGIRSSAIDLNCWNSLALHEKYPYPRAIIHVWTSLDRYTVKIHDTVFPYTPSSSNFDCRLEWAERSQIYVQADRALWKGKTQYYEASFFADTANELKIDHFKCPDVARDDSHPGIVSTQLAAEKILINLKKQGL